MFTINDFLGDYVLSEYSELYPLLRVMSYRIAEGGIDTFLGHQKRSAKDYFFMPARIMKYCCKYVFHKRRNENVYLSDIMLSTSRLNDIYLQLFENYNVCAGLTFSETALKNKPNNIVGRMKDDSRTVFWGHSVCGKKLELEVYSLFGYMKKQATSGCCLSDNNEISCRLSRIERVWNKRVLYVAKRLKKEKVRMYITTSQRYLEDVLIIMACKKAGIVSKELSHHANCYLEIPRDEAEKREKASALFLDAQKPLFFVDESCQWSQADIDYFLKYQPYDSINNSRVKFSIVGCPEASRPIIEQYLKKYTRENAITFFVPYCGACKNVHDPLHVSEAEVEEIASWHKNMFVQLYNIAQKEGTTVYLRYHPDESKESLNADEGVITELGFVKTDTTQEELYRLMSVSRAIFTGRSSTLMTAAIMGCKCFDISFDNSQYDFGDWDIEVIKENEIEKVKLPPIIDNNEVNCIGCFNMSALMS